MFNIFFFFENRAVYGIIKKSGRVRQATDDSIMQRLCFAFWLTKATHTNTHTQNM